MYQNNHLFLNKGIPLKLCQMMSLLFPINVVFKHFLSSDSLIPIPMLLALVRGVLNLESFSLGFLLAIQLCGDELFSTKGSGVGYNRDLGTFLLQYISVSRSLFI